MKVYKKMKKLLSLILIFIFVAALSGCAKKTVIKSRRETESRTSSVGSMKIPELKKDIKIEGDDLIFHTYYTRDVTETYHYKEGKLISCDVKIVCENKEDLEAQKEIFENSNKMATEPLYAKIKTDGLTLTAEKTNFALDEYMGYSIEDLKVYLDTLVLTR